MTIVLDDEDNLFAAPTGLAAARLTVPEIDPDGGTHDAAQAYAAAGFYVLPVLPGSKHPGSRVGHAWQRQSVNDQRDIIAHWAGTNDGIALHAGRSGCVIFDVDQPDRLHLELRRAIDELDPPFQQSRPGTSGRGHYLFETPPGRTLGNSVGQLTGGWGEVRGSNGVIIVAPSIHENADEGGAYTWLRTGPVPILPDYIAELLPEATAANDTASDHAVDTFLEQHTTATRPDLLDRLSHVLKAKVADGGSRHDAAVSVMAGAMKEARAGYFPARAADAQLRGLFVAAVTDPDKTGARDNHQASREWSAIRAWAIGQALHADLHQVHARVADKAPADGIQLAPRQRPPAGVDLDTGELNPSSAHAAQLFAATPLLAHIERFARARRASPWAVLGCVLVRTVCAVEPFVRLPPLIGGDASLNLFLGLVGPSGSGKGAAEAAAADAIDLGSVRIEGVGSGEGVGHMYMTHKAAKGDEPAGWEQHTTRLLLRSPEVDTLAALKGRQGATLLPKLRDAYIGDDLSFAYAAAEKRVPLRAHTYRLGLIVGVQPERAGTLLDDADGGTPQRFLWLPSRDPDIPDVEPPTPARWTGWTVPQWPPALTGTQTVHLEVCDQAKTAVSRSVVARHRGQGDALDGHALLARIKAAAALAILHGESAVTTQWWELSAHLMAVSDATRSEVVATLAARHRTSNLAKAEAEADRRQIIGEREHLATTRRVAHRLETRLTTDWTSRSDLRKALSSTDRPSFEDAIHSLIKAGRVNEETDEYHGSQRIRYRLNPAAP